jgi:hypothetical protein
MANIQPLNLHPVSVPAKAEDWALYRGLKKSRDPNDLVEECHLAALKAKYPGYYDYINARKDEEAVTGRIADDDVIAAHMLKEFAKKQGYDEVANMKASEIKRRLRTVLRRYPNLTRQSRALLNGRSLDNGGGGGNGEGHEPDANDSDDDEPDPAVIQALDKYLKDQENRDPRSPWIDDEPA